MRHTKEKPDKQDQSGIIKAESARGTLNFVLDAPMPVRGSFCICLPWDAWDAQFVKYVEEREKPGGDS